MGLKSLTFSTTSALTNTSSMFSSCASFNQTLVFSDTSGVTTMASMLNACVRFNNGDTTDAGAHPLTWTTSAVRDMSLMFNGCSAFNQTLVFSSVSAVQFMTQMFDACSRFNNGDTTNASSKPLVWTTVALRNANSMFTACSVFNQALTFSDMTHVVTLASALQGCTLFKQDLSAWYVKLCTTMALFFIGDLNDPTSAANQTNYNALLVSWAAEPLFRSGVTLDMGSTKYSAGAAAAARATLTGTWGWTVNDGGVAP